MFNTATNFDKEQKSRQKRQQLINNLKRNYLMTKISTKILICLFKKLLFTMENATAADSSQSNISRLYI